MGLPSLAGQRVDRIATSRTCRNPASLSYAPRLDECLCSHGEENAITQAAYHGVILKGCTTYTTLSPCLMCTKMIINAGLEEVVYNMDYPLGETALNLLREAGVKVRTVSIAAE